MNVNFAKPKIGRTSICASLSRELPFPKMNKVNMKSKTKTVYLLRVRDDDQSSWGEPSTYRTRKERDKTAAYCRIIGGLRTHSYEEKVPAESESEQEQ